ncbi:MAG: hypothetical protein BGN91_04050 [Nitrobacter sp. 62-13]|nr:MAG: hypothetical protein BGN91_04050 [Nitrobacter sp. 62-13]
MPFDRVAAKIALFQQVNGSVVRPLLNLLETTAAIRPLSAVRVAGGDTRLVRVELEAPDRPHRRSVPGARNRAASGRIHLQASGRIQRARCAASNTLS